MEELDKETKKILTDDEKVARFVASDDWKEVKKRLFNKLIAFDSIAGIDKGEKRSFEDIGREAAMREGVSRMVLEWVQEIEGTASHQRSTADLMKKIRTESIVTFFE